MSGKNKNKFLSGFVAGVDEAGRGPLAGPISLACVLCPTRSAGVFLRGIKDSKHLSAVAREKWFEKIKNHPKFFYAFVSVGNAVIDRDGLSKVISIGVRRLLRKTHARYLDNRVFKNKKDLKVFLDGSLSAPEKYTQETIIKGDEKVPIIAAASIVAKVLRDRKMVRLSGKFPKYSFEIHKGYGTRLHYKMLKKHGPCEIHRQTFLK